jgi:predicted O-methyltransferase YrrM
MSNKTLGLPDDVHAYLIEHGVREPELLARLRAETATMPMAQMQIAPEQGAFMGWLVEALGVRRALELGTFTGYSSLAVALAMPDDGRITCLDISKEYTDVARRYWREAGVEHKVDLRLGPALETLADLKSEGAAGTIDFAFLDADKEPYPDYYEAILDLLKPGGVLLVDNVLADGKVVDPNHSSASVQAIQRLNDRILRDERVSAVLMPIADGLTLARRR